MINVYIWGTGANGKRVLDAINFENSQVIGFIDNDPDKQGREFENIRVISSRSILKEHDYIILAVNNSASVLYQLELEKYENFDKIIVFFDERNLQKVEYKDIIITERWRIALLEYKVKKLETLLTCRINNLGYEIVDKWQSENYWYPKIGKSEEAIDKIVSKGYSMIRFGDGEFEIMAGYERAVFQKYDPILAEKLKRVVQSEEEKLLIAIANNYGNLEEYTDNVADGIRLYMNDRVRKFHQEILKKDKTYYDAYMFKCYMPYRDKESTPQRVDMIKKIWNKRDLVIIEGDKTRTGYGNDLFDNAGDVQRLLAPTQNAFLVYDQILEHALKIEKDKLILMALGPAGKVLAYDLVKSGYQVVDIGQIDMDYEWYRAGRGEKVPIPNKYVSQLPPTQILEIEDDYYKRQIIAVIQ